MDMMNTRRPWHRNVRAAMLLVSLGSCLLAAPALAARSITDMAGRVVNIPDEVHKVYAIGHSIPIVAAVAPDKLANGFRLTEAVKRYLPSSIVEGKVVPVGGMRLSDEEVVKMAPDLVIMESIAGSIDQAARLEERLHVPVILVDQDLTKAKAAFAFLGNVLGRPEQGQALADFVTCFIDPIAAKARTIPEASRVKVYYAEGPNGLATNPAGSIHTQVIDFVGGINVAAVAPLSGEATNPVSLEQLYSWKPDVILVWTPNADKLTTWQAIVDDQLWRRLEAVKTGRVIQIPWLPFSWFDRPPGSNRILGIPWLAQTLYPETYRLDLPTITREYFRRFYHRELSDAEASELLNLSRPRTTEGRLP